MGHIGTQLVVLNRQVSLRQMQICTHTIQLQFIALIYVLCYEKSSTSLLTLEAVVISLYRININVSQANCTFMAAIVGEQAGHVFLFQAS